ncbi:MAG TPA: putative sulfate exporter family transporter [Bacteriovoracaceae bacterium]|nr:putative sulfate exporter family transporter [Bacteriovoracaceae bacterium]
MTLSPQWMLLSGIVFSFFLKNEKIKTNAKKAGACLLQISVILLGASLNFHSVIKQGAPGVAVTFISIAFVFLLGHLGYKCLKLDKIQALLLTMGTAICGGSAIGALAPVISADSMAITISIGVVFILNAIAVFIFPFVGDLFSLTQEQFGLWAALAIHDTSSVVAASSIYGNKALEVATTIKLTRALWIIPITLFFSFKFRGNKKKISFPWFILGFIILSLLFTFIETPALLKSTVAHCAKIGFSLTLFLIGLTFDLRQIKQVGSRPLIFGVMLWIIVSVLSLILILN